MTIKSKPPADLVIGSGLVRALLWAQHPDLADLALVEAGEGWDNQLYRLGDSLAVRLPRRTLAADLIVHEQRWLTRLWDESVSAVPWSGRPVWLHGDLHPGNLVVRGNRLAAVADFGDLTAGDPATDLSVAWSTLPPTARPIFRAAASNAFDPIDDATWVRARGWALTLGLVCLANSFDDPQLEALGHSTVQAALEDDSSATRA